MTKNYCFVIFLVIWFSMDGNFSVVNIFKTSILDFGYVCTEDVPYVELLILSSRRNAELL
jgi:hypothetical protein